MNSFGKGENDRSTIKEKTYRGNKNEAKTENAHVTRARFKTCIENVKER